MSAIFGILNLDGRPVDPQHLAAMQHAMSSFGPDGAAVWSDGPVGLGHLLLHNTPESLHESLPIANSSGEILVTATGRLDNRVDLFDRLGVPSLRRSEMPDGALILAAYEKWGPDCPQRLIGDWSFAAWDTRNRRLVLARDHFGVTGLYFHRGQRTLSFASSLNGLFAQPDVPRRLNPAVMGGSGFTSRDFAATQFEGVMRLRPAQAMSIESRNTRSWLYWNPEGAADVRLASVDDYVEAFLDVYTEAVTCRLRSHRTVGTMLSGGLDSASIAALAARELAQRGERLPAFSAIPVHDVSTTTPGHRSGDESSNVSAICELAGNIDLTVIRTQTRTPLQALDDALSIHHLPNGTANYTWLLELLETAQRMQLGALLDRWGGNLTVSWVGNRPRQLAELLKGRAWGPSVHEVRARSTVRQSPVWYIAAIDAVSALAPASWLERARRVKHPRPTIVSRDVRSSLRRDPRTMSVDVPASRARNPQLQHFFRGACGATALFSELGAAFGLEIRQPAMDKRVIEFCAGIPLEQFASDGDDRVLIKRAMSGLVPESVLNDRKRGLQSADAGQQIRSDGARTAQALSALGTSPLARHYVNLPRMNEALEAINDRLDDQTFLESNILLSGLILGRFLEGLDDEES